MGDLNYRIDNNSEFIKKCLSNNNSQDLLEFDQLTLESKSNRLSLNGFEEAEIKFNPTYRYKEGTNDYDDKERVPGWTDRILYKIKNKQIVNKGYGDLKLTLSDHKPVYGLFDITMIKKPLDKFDKVETIGFIKKINSMNNLNNINKKHETVSEYSKEIIKDDINDDVKNESKSNEFNIDKEIELKSNIKSELIDDQDKGDDQDKENDQDQDI